MQEGTQSIQPPDELVSPTEAARRLGITPGTLAIWADEGKVPCIKTEGGHRRYLISAIDALLKKLSCKPETEIPDEPKTEPEAT